MRRETLFKKIAIDRLSGSGALTGGDNHLAIRRRHTPSGVQSRHTRAHAWVDFDLPVCVQFRAELFGQAGVKNIAARGENVIDLHAPSSREIERADLAPAVFDVSNAFSLHRDFVFRQPTSEPFTPRSEAFCRSSPQSRTRGIVQHPERVFDGFVV